MENIVSKRQKRKYLQDGFIYVFDRMSACGSKIFWRCAYKARIHTENGSLVKKINDHSHDSSVAKVEVDAAVSRIKERAGEVMETTAQVINACIGGLSEGAQGTMPNHGALRKMIRRKRNQVRAAPPMPKSVENLIIPNDYKFYEPQTGIQKNFLLADSGPVPGRIIIFGREQNLHVLCESDHWFIDGTFKLTPPLFAQVYVILAEKFGGVYPLLYVLLPNKQRATYTTMLDMLKNLEPNLNPAYISSDFELAATSAFKTAFQTAEMQECFFHLTKNMKKHVATLNLIGRYNTDADFALQARMVVSLAFVPTADVDAAIDRLVDVLPVELQPLLEWFEDFYVGRMNRRGNGRRSAMFPPVMWSLYNRVINDMDRTNNHAEAAHCRLQTEMGMDLPNLWKFIDGLRRIQKSRDMFYEHLIAGHEPPKKIKKYRDADTRIKAIVGDYANRDIIDYLRGLSYNYYEMHPQ